jgi:hypothetical protein
MLSGTHRVFVRNLVFYTGVRQVDLETPEHLAAFLRSDQPVLCVVARDDLERLEASSGLRPRRLASVQYFNPAAVRLRTALAPDPRKDLDTVVLVTNRDEAIRVR